MDHNRKEQVSFPLINMGNGMKGLILQGDGLDSNKVKREATEKYDLEGKNYATALKVFDKENKPVAILVGSLQSSLSSKSEILSSLFSKSETLSVQFIQDNDGSVHKIEPQAKLTFTGNGKNRVLDEEGKKEFSELINDFNNQQKQSSYKHAQNNQEFNAGDLGALSSQNFSVAKAPNAGKSNTI
jgi:hypothetical protein